MEGGEGCGGGPEAGHEEDFVFGGEKVRDDERGVDVVAGAGNEGEGSAWCALVVGGVVDEGGGVCWAVGGAGFEVVVCHERLCAGAVH